MRKFLKILSIILGIIVISYFILSHLDLIDVDDYATYNNFKKDSRLEHPEQFQATSLAIINTATAPAKQGMAIGGESIFKDYTISHSAILIRHEKGNVFFDTGLGEHIDEQFKEMPGLLQPLLKFNFNKSALDQVSNKIEHPDNIILSHLHWDHAGGIEDFPDSEIWTSKLDLDTAMVADNGSLKSQLDSKSIKWNFIDYNDIAYENFPKSFDFYGDGSLVLVPMPGHTPGSLGLFVNLQSGKRYLLTGDVTYGLLGFTKPAEKSFLLKYAIDTDREVLIQTILRVHYLMKQYPDLIVVPAHDSEVQNSLPQFK